MPSAGVLSFLAMAGALLRGLGATFTLCFATARAGRGTVMGRICTRMVAG